MIFHENCLPADNSHEISCLFLLKKQQNLKVSSAANSRWRFMVSTHWLLCLLETRNILKKDIRRLSNTDDKRNQILWFRRNSNLPLRPLHAGI